MIACQSRYYSSRRIIPGLVINEKGNIEIRAKLSSVGQELAPSLRMGLDGKISEIILYFKGWNPYSFCHEERHCDVSRCVGFCHDVVCVAI